MSDDIYSKIAFKISHNTLRRFFGLVKSNYHPAPTTLDILSRYCAFSSFDGLIKVKKESTKALTNNHNYPESVLNYLISIFKENPAKDQYDKTFLEVAKQTILFLTRHPKLIDKFQRAISKTRSGQDVYFEQFINIDKLNSFYGSGLLYYLAKKNNRGTDFWALSFMFKGLAF